MRATRRPEPGSDSTNGISGTVRKPAITSRAATRHVSRGQVVILFAAALIGLLGLLGLATDLGYAFAERRTMQNAADAGAIAGAHTISNSPIDAPLTVLSDVKETAQANRIGDKRPTVTRCEYVDDHEKVVGSCSKPVPPTATGVTVTVKETHNTFFIGIIPGGPNSVSTQASATAHVQTLQNLPSDGPFLVCGINPDVVDSHGQGNKIDIAIPGPDASNPWILNPKANGVVFQIHGPQINHCGLDSSKFKGAALQTSNQELDVPNWFSFTNGDDAGPITQSVRGIQGCKADGQPVNDCVAFLPIAVPDPNQSAHPGQLWTVLIAPFYIEQVGANKHNGTLIGDYVVDGGGEPGWKPGQQQPLVIRLTK